MDRRQFLAVGAGLPASAWLASCGGSGSMEGSPMAMPPAGRGGAVVRSGLPFAAPPLVPVFRSGELAEITLTAAPASVDLGGLTTEFWTFNGSLPGPTIELREGDHVRVTFRNRLPQPSTVHWHGLPVPASQDGNPMDPVAPGTDRLYEFTLPRGCAGTYWYHPHAHRTTAEQVARGLAGLFIVRDAADPLAATGIVDVPLVVTDLRVDGAGRVAATSPVEMMNGRVGDTLLVNGLRSPRLPIRAGETQRWRILNATNARYLRLAIAGQGFTLVGTDGGLTGAPSATLTEILLAPAERAELLVRGRGAPGAAATFDALAYDHTGIMMMGAGSPATNVLVLETVAGEAPPFAMPATLRPIAPLAAGETTRRVVLAGDGMMTPFSIDGRTFSMGRVDAVSRRGAVERWDIVNTSPVEHPFHLHGTQFQVVSRGPASRPVPEPALAWKDTVNVRPGEVVSIRFRHDEPGLRMYHCHILEHEDAGMMGVLSVT